MRRRLISRLAAALEPFVIHNASTPTIQLTVRTAAVRSARNALTAYYAYRNSQGVVMSDKQYVLKKDITIPAGTVFKNIDSSRRTYVNGNFEATIGLSKDSSGSLIYGIEPKDMDCMEFFEELP